MPRLLFLMLAASTLAAAAPARAETQAYCELYAKDFADGRTSNVDQWQLVFRGAFDDCMTQYAATPDEQAPVAQAPQTQQPKEETKAAAEEQSQEATEQPQEAAEPPPKPKPKAKVVKVQTKKTSTTVAAKAPNKRGLVPGSEAWNDYCDAKYRSFNRQSGTYLSGSGKVRRCKVN
jgi:outer membrane biosynthesis protein TonB